MTGHKQQENSHVRKWGSALDGGFQVVPNVLLKVQGRLNLDSVDVVILLNLNLHWWDKDDLPYPSPTMIAKRMGVSRRTVERRIFKMQKVGLLKRQRSEGDKGKLRIRRYDLGGLVQKLQEAAVVDLNRREYRETQKNRFSASRAPRREARQVLALGSG